MDFDEVWKDIIKIVEETNEIATLRQGNINRIESLTERGLMVVTTNEPKLVRKEWIEAAWNVLSERKCITAKDIPAQGEYRSSFILALLSKLEYVRFDINPITLYLNI